MFSSLYIDPALSPVLAIVFYVIKLLFQCCIQEEFNAFDNVRDASETNEFLEAIRKRSPTAKFSVQCYHYEYTVERDQDGHETQKKERVNTLSEDKFIQIAGFVDKTAPMYVKDAHSLIYLDISQEIQWSNTSQQWLDQIRQNIQNWYSQQDEYVEIDFKTEIPDLTLDNYLKLGQVPSWISKRRLWLSTFF